MLMPLTLMSRTSVPQIVMKKQMKCPRRRTNLKQPEYSKLQQIVPFVIKPLVFAPCKYPV
jgi:hypothetical protein